MKKETKVARDKSTVVAVTHPKSSTAGPVVLPARYSPLPCTSDTPNHIRYPPPQSVCSAEELSTSKLKPVLQETTTTIDRSADTSNYAAADHTQNKSRLTKGRQRHEDQWKRNIAKRLRQSGKEYVSPGTGTIRPAKQVDYSRNCDLNKCKFECQRRISRQTQRRLCELFWALGSKTKQNSYYENTITEVKSNQRQRSAFKGKRSVTRKFYLHVDNQAIQVCQRFYTSTLVISRQRIAISFQTRDKRRGSKTTMGQG